MILLILFTGYLSYFGIETKQFNKIIKEKIIEKNKRLNINLKSLRIKLDLSDFSFNLQTQDPEIVYDKNTIQLKSIASNFSVKSLINKDLLIRKVKISSKKVQLMDLLAIVRIYKDNPKFFILYKIIKDGFLVADFELNFDENGKLKKDYKISGHVKEANLKLLNKKNIENINFNFNIINNKYLLKNLNTKFLKLDFNSELITINNFQKYINVEGDISNQDVKIPDNLLPIIFNHDVGKLNNIILGSKNNFSFKINKKFKIQDFIINSNLNIKNMNYNFENLILKNHIPKFENMVQLKNHKIKLDYIKNILTISGDGKFIIGGKKENIKYNIIKENNNYNFKSKLEIYNNLVVIKSLNYKKKKKVKSILSIEGIFNNNIGLSIKKLLYEENKNIFLFNDLIISKNFKINSLKKIDLKFTNTNKIKNKVVIKKNKTGYEIVGKTIDLTLLIDKLLDEDSNNDKISFLNKFNSNINVNVLKVFLNNESFVENLKGNFKIKNSRIENLAIISKFSDDKDISLTINTNGSNEKITTLYTGNAAPFVKRYKFIKGFDKGDLDFYSIKKNNISKSRIKIYDFKLKEVPLLTKLLTLASLQGIADLVTGEGIRFDEFEMNFTNESHLMNIDEIYAIGPAISIMMSGYIEKSKLISLRGTLVPATTINKVVGSIPILGKILVGKKTGEGVFGVSFKIKGPPKNLKTSVNPIKTLTPRFITRTLEKIKKN